MSNDYRAKLDLSTVTGDTLTLECPCCSKIGALELKEVLSGCAFTPVAEIKDGKILAHGLDREVDTDNCAMYISCYECGWDQEVDPYDEAEFI